MHLLTQTFLLAQVTPDDPIARELARLQHNYEFLSYGLAAAWIIIVLYVLMMVARERKLTDWLDAQTRRELAGRQHPATGLAEFTVRFCTHEEILRKTGGDYYQFFR